MDSVRKDFLARSRLTDYQYRQIGGGRLHGRSLRLLHGDRLSHNSVKRITTSVGLLQFLLVVIKSALQHLYLTHQLLDLLRAPKHELSHYSHNVALGITQRYAGDDTLLASKREKFADLSTAGT